MPLDLSGHPPQTPLSKHWRLSPGKKKRLASLPEEPSLRHELFSAEQLIRHAHTLAGWHTVAGSAGHRCADALLPRLDANEEVLREAYDLMSDAVKLGCRITPAAEWFLDNYHLIQEQIATARRYLPKKFNRELPRLGTGPHAGGPRVYAIALELISHVDGRVDIDNLRAFVTSYQSTTPLRLGELWAIPIMLRLALLENLRRVVVRIAAGRRDRERAAFWVDCMLEAGARAPTEVVQVLADLAKVNPSLSAAFVTEFAGHMQGQAPAMAFSITWLEQRLAEQGQTVETMRQQTSQSQASDQVSIGNIIGSLRLLGATEWRDFVEELSSTEAILRTDPSGTYPRMTFDTRDQCRHAVEAVSKACTLDEVAVSRLTVALASKHADAQWGGPDPLGGDNPRAHVGHFLIGEGRRTLERTAGVRAGVDQGLRRLGRRFPLALYGGTIILMTALLTASALAWLAGQGVKFPVLIAAGLPLAMCASQLAVALTNGAVMRLVRPRLLPRMDFSEGIPPEHLSVVAVPAMLCDGHEVNHLVEALEVRFLSNRDPNLLFALLTDFPDCATETIGTDAPLLRQACDAIAALNAKYPGGHFFLFHRARRWNPGEKAWMGWERKRGKLEDFNHTLCGEAGRFATIVGDTARLEGVRYVIPLDSDTQLPRDTAKKLVGTMAHPLNRPVYDLKRGRVTAGYGILQPRVGISVPSANRSLFARLFAGEPGIDPYSHAVSDVYQDIMGEGSFVGKGIYDLNVFQQALGRRLPENRVLSHDLLESGYARSGLVSDVILFEDYPSAYPANMSRCCRWIRGDWQIAPWLFSRVPGSNGRWVRNPLSTASQWKILDNLRRSLVPVALLALLILGWFLPGCAPAGILAVAAVMLLPAACNSLAQLVRRPVDLPFWPHARGEGRSLLRHALQQCVVLACLPYEAFMNLDAIGRVFARLMVTQSHLLEWRTARDAQRSSVGDLTQYCTHMWIAPATAFLLSIAMGCVRPEAMAAAAPVLGLWLVSPLLAFRLSQTILSAPARMSESDLTFLRMTARRTWQFFEAFVGPEDHHLPPDNFQEKPMRGLAHRTSPTNIGVSLLANLAAYDFGFIPASEVVERTTRTLDTLDKLERHRGHFYNWYDTQTLAPLHPSYVSSVDSGNLAGHLLVLASGLEEMAQRAHLRLPIICSGLGATFDLVLDAARPHSVAHWMDLVMPLESLRKRLHMAQREAVQVRELLRQAALTSASLADAIDSDEGHELKWWAEALHRQSRLADHDLNLLPSALLLQNAALEKLADRCRALADAMEYGFLYDRDRHLLAIGYNVSNRCLDPGFYDLLASEARLVSFVAIAQGKLPQENWFALGRAVTHTESGTALLSWSGSMFEYLMPLLVMPTHKNTLLDTTYRTVVKRQVAYGRERGVPWGISECGYTKTDAQLNYQYRSFGIPGLGFKRGLADELVVAPYASALALMVDPETACANLQRLAGEGRLGVHGFYEAVDYAPERLPRGQASAMVRSYMAHHQGMVFLALAYALLDKPMQRRFAADPALRATSLLLEERVPKTPAVFPHPAEVSAAPEASAPAGTNFRVFTTPNTRTPEVHLLSNGRYHVAVTAAGGGHSHWHDLAVTRWREDATRDCWGNFCYLRDADTGSFWSAASQPAHGQPTAFEAVFSQGRAEFRRRDGDIETLMEIGVSPEDDIELRRISITNRGDAARILELTSYAEVVLAPPATDAAHPAFGNLFVQTELVRERQAILCTRRPRSAGEKPPWMLHLMGVDGATCAPTSYETSRANFIGRAGSLSDPAAMHQTMLSGTEGSVLDPVAAIRSTITVRPDETVRVHLVTGMAETREGVLALAEKYNDPRLAGRVFDLAWTHSQAMLHHLDATLADAQLYSRLAGSILYANPLLRAPGPIIARNKRGQAGLWAYGISGDLPIVLLRIGDIAHMPLARQLIQAQAYWRTHGLLVDLIVWNEDQSGYRQVLQEELMAAVASRGASGLLDKPGGLFIRRSDQISEEDKVLMQAVARVIMSGSAGTIAQQLDRMAAPGPPVHKLRPTRSHRLDTSVPRPATAGDRIAFNGIGGFSPDGDEYVITTSPGHPTPAPWVNVIANPWFGTVVSESGGAYTWCENAHAFRLTPWHNDAVSDTSGEAFYLRDEESGWFWSPSPLPARGPAPYTTRHGFGYSIFETVQDGVSTHMSVHVATDAPVKFITLRVRNESDRTRKLSATGFFELSLGDRREIHAAHVVTETDPKTNALFASNAFNGEFAQRTVFLDSSEPRRTLTGDRGEFLGRNGNAARPVALSRARLSGRVGAGLDPCAAMQAPFDLAPGQEHEIAFIFGTGRDLADARNLVNRFRGVGPARAALEGTRKFWGKALGALRVETPDASVNFLANGWLLYQTIASRLWGRSGFYQSGGAFGFRDQLQDAMALVHAHPTLLRDQLLRAASRQFREGDVQHWWHPPAGRGVRTRISDDYLWLPYATCRYVAALGDTGVLDEQVAFLAGHPVQPAEESYCDLPSRTEETATLYEHCLRAVKNGLRFGEHGLPLMGTGDWNDGMNLVGVHGRGESVWLAFFLHDVLTRFSGLAKRRGDEDTATFCTTEAEKLRLNIEAHGWDGQWYRRAYFDNGEPLGSASNSECRFDSLPQSWAVLSGAGDPARAHQAMAEVDGRLVSRDTGIIRLFDPPFDKSKLDPGYIKGYVPGVRENGGQYTHAAIWVVMAFAAIDDIASAWELFQLINPVRHGGSRSAIETYKVEPYVVAADVYSCPPHAGRGGWTWYTGSAGWMYRLVTESLLGIYLEADQLRFAPRLPADWSGFKIRYRYRETVYHIHVRNMGGGKTLKHLMVDGVRQMDGILNLRDDHREHLVEVGVD